jgi:DNA-binding NtrC family response regulator
MAREPSEDAEFPISPDLTHRSDALPPLPREIARCLVRVNGGRPEDEGKTLLLENAPAVVGRDVDCDISLADRDVSRRHVRLELKPDGVQVEDLGSTNGIFCLGERIEKGTVRLGGKLSIGGTTLDFLPLEDERSTPPSGRNKYGELVGISLPMRRIFTLLEALERSDAPVLIEGETGTGKELVARALHENSRRADMPFIVIDCANVPSELMESELFGHRKGSFTGAVDNRVGAFELANGGTVFLDELGELPPPLQPKLLRVLETGEIKRIGEGKLVPVDVRIIAATKRKLAQEMAQGRFRDDLYYRVAVIQIRLPSLRERREDIPLLVRELVTKLSKGMQRRLSPDAEEYLMHQDWPGNVRELRNVLHRTLALHPVDCSDLPVVEPLPVGNEPVSGKQTRVEGKEAGSDYLYHEARERSLRSFERSYLARLWTETGRNLSKAARMAGLDRKYLRRLLRKHGLH